MKYFIDTEFIEGPQVMRMWGMKEKTVTRMVDIVGFIVGVFFLFYVSIFFGLLMMGLAVAFFITDIDDYTKDTIDLISIGIVAEDGREYYRISSDFNIHEAWHRYDLKPNKQFPRGPEYHKVYWIRNNVLKPIFDEHVRKFPEAVNSKFTYNNFRKVVEHFGVSNKQIAAEIKDFVDHSNYSTLMSSKNRYTADIVTYRNECDETQKFREKYPGYVHIPATEPEFYAYYADYDWVVFCWLYGRMIDLPDNFPMFCRDIQQNLTDLVDEMWESSCYGENLLTSFNHRTLDINTSVKPTKKQYLRAIKMQEDYPQNNNTHNALDDARWNRDLYNFIKDF